MPKEQVAGMERMIPTAVKRNIAVLAFTEIGGLADAASMNAAIPFFGLLLGIAYIGHAVWIFEGHPTALAAGCRNADALIVDSGMIPFLQPDWAEVASRAMRNKGIYLHDRATFSLRPVR